MLGKYIKNSKVLTWQSFATSLSLFLVFMTISTPASAQVSAIAANIVDSIEDLPGLASAFSYLLGLLFGVRGVLKLKEHVENPGNGSGQTPIRTPIISFIVGGALFALPIILEAAATTIDGNSATGFGAVISSAALGTFATLFGGSVTGAGNFNDLLSFIAVSLSTLPGFISAISYLLGLVIVILGLIKVKEHVETPEQTKLSEAVIRLLAGGALLTMPTIYNAMFNTIDGTGGASSLISLFTGVFTSATSTCVAGTGGLGQRICGIVTHTGLFPAFLTGIAYLFGLTMGVWGVLKIRDHVLNPQQTTVFEGVSRLIAGGAFFALPLVVQAFSDSVVGGGFGGSATTGFNYGSGGTIAGYVATLLSTGSCPASALGLDALMVCFAADILGPVHVLLNFFAFVAGIIFIMIGISRLIKGAQEGAKAPGGLGTLMTFGIGGALVSYNEIIRATTTTITGSSTTLTNATMNYTTGMTTVEADAAHAVITSIVKFMIVVGLISFVRGLFIVRDVAEGSQQASMMAGVTHLIGGTLAINLGPVINAVQETLGTTAYGITFT